jgi:hypothetical protein
MRFFSEHVQLFLDNHLLQKNRGDSGTKYIQIATIDIGKAESAVNKRHPYDGTINIATKYSNILPNDQNNSMTIIIVARVVDGKYSSINVDPCAAPDSANPTKILAISTQ